MASKAAISGVVLVVFGAFSGWVIAQKGYFGFLTLALQEPWGGQLFIDLCIALVFVTGWMIRDAKSRDMNPWPYVVATPFVGSMAPLLYLVVRGLRKPAAQTAALQSNSACT